VAEQYNGHLLPPLTLQLLVENAVKHNVTSRQRPLNINISTTENGQLLVKNNLQKKTTKVESHKIGLDNIAVKYRLLQQGEVTAKETDGSFIVTIPLIHPQQAPSI
jgi:two-component system, LytTR family, sensor kinase